MCSTVNAASYQPAVSVGDDPVTLSAPSPGAAGGYGVVISPKRAYRISALLPCDPWASSEALATHASRPSTPPWSRGSCGDRLPQRPGGATARHRPLAVGSRGQGASLRCRSRHEIAMVPVDIRCRGTGEAPQEPEVGYNAHQTVEQQWSSSLNSSWPRTRRPEEWCVEHR